MADDSFHNIDYFDFFKDIEVEFKGKTFKLSRKHTWEINKDVLEAIVDKLDKRRDKNSLSQLLLAQKATAIFSDKIRYNNYLQEIDADKNKIEELNKQLEKLSKELDKLQSGSHSTDNRRSHELEEQLKQIQDKLSSEFERISLTDSTAQEKIQELQEKILDLEGILKASIDKNNSPQKPLWKQVIREIGRILIEDTNTPQPPSNPPPRNIPPAQVPSINLSGVWRDVQGATYLFEQRGNQLRVQGRNAMGAVILEGEGTVFGNTVQISYQNYFYHSYGQSQLNISANGWRLDGMVNDSYSGTIPATLFRQS
ncbi:hypothetical protein [Nostoc sp. FACHB-133]|uniref:hypothetical protein n=1 Tax=Nostoc sp. FACHB-133 TaxID=2692835 RepID=UPI00168359D7|nr:hypothetical protein [Nostoc sp. FACHB-133]MBD2521725.1 hypothetical protein [Nostoc sp. FACHB-133]